MPIKPRPLISKKLLNSKWTAVTPLNKEKHFMVTKLLVSDVLPMQLESVELEAVYTKRKQILPWQTLANTDLWLQGWV